MDAREVFELWGPVIRPRRGIVAQMDGVVLPRVVYNMWTDDPEH